MKQTISKMLLIRSRKKIARIPIKTIRKTKKTGKTKTLEDKSGSPIKPYTREQVETMLKTNGVKIDERFIYDAVYVANMAKADFYGSSIADEQHLAKYVGDYLNDPDGTPEIPFVRFYADTVIKGVPIYWEDML